MEKNVCADKDEQLAAHRNIPSYEPDLNSPMLNGWGVPALQCTVHTQCIA